MCKKEGDSITLDEFSSFLQRRHLDANFSMNEQRLMFEKFDKKFNNRINVSDVLSYCGSEPGKHEFSYRDAGEVKTHVIDVIEKRRIASKLSLEVGETQKQLRSAFRNLDPDSTGFISKEKLEWALGPEYLALNLSPEEAKEAVRNIVAEGKKRKGGVKAENTADSVNYDAFVHYLGLLNSDPNYHPFYDSRSQQLSYMNRKIAELDAAVNDPERLKRAKELERNAQLSKLHLLNSPTGAKTAPNIGTVEQHAESFPCRAEDLMEPQDFDMTFNSAASSPSKLVPSSAAPDADTFGSPISTKHRATGKTNEKIFRKDKSLERPSPRMLTRSDSSHLDDSIIQQQVTREQTEKRRAFQQKGIWEGLGPVDQTTPLYCTARDRFHTTSAEYFPKLIYEPSRPVERDRIGDSSVAFQKNANRRAGRASRLKHNLTVTANRLEERKFLDSLRADEREKRKAMDLLSYEQTVLVRDMNKFKKREVEVMQRKPVMNQYTKMWGSHMQNKSKDDDRDFGTTYMLGFGGNLYNGPAHASPIGSARSLFSQNHV